MKMIRSYGLAMVLVCMTLMVASCGKSDDSSTPAAVYKVEYVPGTGMNAPTEGKTTFQLKITKTSDGSPASGLTPTLSFLMTMTSGDQHATPIDLVSESSTTPGTYDCTVYYMMASGATMGTWEMTVTVNDETTKFNPDVAMSMKSDTVKATLKGQNDIISSMSGTEKRSYYIFNDGLTSGMSMGSGTLNLFIAAKDSMMSFPALSRNRSAPRPCMMKRCVMERRSRYRGWFSGWNELDIRHEHQGRSLVDFPDVRHHLQRHEHDLCPPVGRQERWHSRAENH